MSEGTNAVEFTAAARKQLPKLDRTAQLRILKATLLQTINPRPSATRRLASIDELWRVRVGDYRLVYSIEDKKLVIAIAIVGHRSSAYRGIDLFEARTFLCGAPTPGVS